MIIQDLVDFLDKKLYPEYQESYDNAGLILGDTKQELQGVLTTTDITPKVIDEAIVKGCNFIISHHPLIFKGIKRITSADETGRMVMQLLKHCITVYAAHTNLDNLEWGVNGILSQRLGLEKCHILRPMNESLDSVGAGMFGQLPHPLPMDKFLCFVKEKLKLPVIRVSANYHPNAKKEIIKIAICGGSGSFLIDDAIACGADIFLTGDLKYHDFQSAEDSIVLADIGHYESEQFAKELFYHLISEKFSNFACQISEQDCGYINYI
ncbi:MAG: Nif3-like dinuclear metal center hexameric protein [Bacteroidales bacterium]|nr:Nif3-like dinuclear metal center hexameric protein [Bacteroidales bacterium]